MTRSDLIDAVITQIKRDILDEEISALERLLDNLPDDDLKSFLPEIVLHNELNINRQEEL